MMEFDGELDEEFAVIAKAKFGRVSARGLDRPGLTELRTFYRYLDGTTVDAEIQRYSFLDTEG